MEGANILRLARNVRDGIVKHTKSLLIGTCASQAEHRKSRLFRDINVILQTGLENGSSDQP